MSFEREIYYLKKDKIQLNHLNVYDSFNPTDNGMIGYLDSDYNFRQNDYYIQRKNYITHYPYVTKNKLPSYKELINSVPEFLKNKNLCMGYLKKNKYKDYYIMEIIIWDFEYSDNYGSPVYNPKIILDPNKKIKKLYDKVKVFNFEKKDNGDIEVYTKQTPPLTGYAYMWEWKNKEFLGIYENGKIKMNNGKRLELVEDKPTIHSYAYSGFFKPDINEVLNNITHENILDVDEFYITTELLSNDIYECQVNNYHIGITKVFV